MLSWKVLMAAVAVVLAAVGLKASIPLLPLLWNFFLLCFSPPYLYIFLNAIIISILASSRFHFHHSSGAAAVAAQSNLIPHPPILQVNPVTVHHQEEVEKNVIIQEGIVLKRTSSTEIPPEHQSAPEKPLVSARFGHRKPPKSIYEGGRALRVVAKAKRHDTLENTWKMITEGRSMPLSRHVRKCDTWQNRGDVGPADVEATVSSVSPGRLRKEPSLSQDELNRRVEEFIRKFNDDMRLQRQQSLEQYMQMINRGAA